MVKPRTYKPLVFGPLKKPPEEKSFLVWDVETKPKYPGEPINTLWLGGGLYDGISKPQVFESEDLFFETLLAPCFVDHWLYAHNASGFDFHYLLRFLCRRKIPWTAYRTGQRIFVSACGREFYDSAAILRGSLASIGEELGLEVKKWTVDKDFYKEIEARNWQPYLIDDLKSLFEAIQITRESIGKIGGVLRPTLASTSMTLFRLQYLKDSIECLSPDRPEPEIFRKAYLGGRVECFKHKMSEGNSWDINSSYPYSMIDHAGIPCDFLGGYKTNKLPTDPSIVHATVTVPPDERHPPLAMIGNDQRLYFATGRRSAWFTSVELAYCREKYGHSSVVIDQAYLFKPRNIFDSFVKDLYNIKGKKGVVGYVAKLCMNSLYGKFGMKRDREKIVCGEEWHSWPWDNEKAMRKFKNNATTPHKKVISDEDYIFTIPDKANFAPYIMPQIAATVTARSRILLQSYLDRAGSRSCYCDTDSIYAEAPQTFFETSKNLGELKLESRIKSAIFAAPKVYHIIEEDGTAKGKAKGLSHTDASQVLRFINGEAIKCKRLLGIFETRKRTKKADPVAEWQEKRARVFSNRRHETGRAFSVRELQRLGVLDGGT